MKITDKIFGTHSQRELKRIKPLVEKIESMRNDMMKLSDEELRAKTDYFKNELKNGKTLDDILPEAYAVVREAARRVLGMEHYPVQLYGGIILHQGRIAEMKTGEGKAVLTSQKIPTPSGWKLAKDIKIGDFLFDRKGKPTKVVGVYPQGAIDTYEVELKDGRIIKCSPEHLWSVYKEYRAKKLTVLNTEELFKTQKIKRGNRYLLPMCEPVEYDEKNLKIAPYVMGLFLGNGCKNPCGIFELSTQDLFTVKEVERLLNADGVYKHPGCCSYTFYKDQANGKRLKISEIDSKYTELLSNTYSYNKYIPTEYKTSSIAQRFSLLQGLLDSDGNIYKGGNRYNIQFSTTSKQLKDDIMEVIYSLGMSCTCRFGKLAGSGNAKHDQYVIRINVPHSIKKDLFRTPKKKEIASEAANIPPKKRDYSRIAIKEIRKLDEKNEQVCFAVDNEERLFLVGDYVVTHNTLVSTLPAYLNALNEEGVHIVTVNDYLAKRDSEWMGKVHEFLGLSVGCVLNQMDQSERQQAYNCDITYITNNEDGFDYLRDNMAVYKENQVQRGLSYAIIDEVDSVLIDEARTPLIISGAGGKSTKLYELCDILARQLERGEASGEVNKMTAIMGEEITETGDFIVNEKDKVVTLTEEGVSKVEKFFKIDNLSDAENIEIQHNIILALRAHNLMHRDQDYVVKDDEVLIVDEFTGRIMPGRRFSDGLHQAIEAKEHVKVRKESKTLATITFQNFFNKYKKKAGMTGTAMTEEQEFRDIYGMDVISIPTNLPIARIDNDDAVYLTKEEKYNAVINEVLEAHKRKQPVLVGTITIETSELLAKMLKRAGIRADEFSVLNAKFHELEAEIVSHAGEAGAITIATNMAGRGTDIKLDEEARAAGGLKIIGTERHESRRIDNQLRGRSGRQGDPGESRFFISLEDDLMRLFGSERLMNTFKTLGVSEGEQIEHKMLTSAIEKAQQKIESNNFAIRKNLLDYDAVNNEQREIIYEERSHVLNGENMHDVIVGMIDDTVSRCVDTCIGDEADKQEWDIQSLGSMISEVIPIGKAGRIPVDNLTKSELKQRITEIANDLYKKKEESIPEGIDFKELERVVLLRVIDQKWMDHIDNMEMLREGIGLQAYGQKDPKVEYKMIAYDMFNDMTEAIQEDTVRYMYQLQVEVPQEREQVAEPVATNKDDSLQKKSVQKTKKIYPNDPCPCGSGKKYKKCCGAKVKTA